MALASRRYRVTWLVVTVFVLILLFTYNGSLPTDRVPSAWPSWSPPGPAHDETASGPAEALRLPLDYEDQTVSSNSWCEDRFGTAYLENVRDTAVSYCTPESQSRLSCFWGHTDEGSPPRKEAMCFGRNAVYDPSQRRFKLDCNVRELTPNETDAGAGKVPDDLTRYWYETGPGTVAEMFLTLGHNKVSNGEINRTTILVKREGSQNPWHSLMEIMTFTYTLDILQITIDPETNEPFLTAKDGQDTQVIILDDNEDGPYIELWRMFAKLPIRRLNDLKADEPPSNIILPLAGGSNTLWQGDWKPLNCRDSALIKTFVRRVLKHYDVPQPQHTEDVIATFIKRTNTRKLVNETDLLKAAESGVPNIKIQEVEFESMSFPEQLAIVQKTDLLSGVHGAGLTHALFLPPGSAIAEILPSGFFHKGFRNVAQLMGSSYFSTHGAEPVKKEGEEDSDWQMDAVAIEDEKFVKFIGEAARALYNRGSRSHDVI